MFCNCWIAVSILYTVLNCIRDLSTYETSYSQMYICIFFNYTYVGDKSREEENR
jgi:hypothetical protein